MLKHPTGPTDDPCAAVRAQVFAACDGEIDTADVHVIDMHLAACAACRDRYAADATFHRVVRSAAALDLAPPALQERVMQALHTRTTENAPA